mmetsp:Transcript_27560/g.58967  ORF Transcript_27560/g.58967 Transcript_27560/m.58967 type:complete len:191 (+) Transcript_27560:16-588(+)
MGNCCFGSSSAATPEPAPAPAHDRPPKRQKKEQPFVTEEVEALRNQASTYHDKVVQCAKQSQEAYQKGEKAEAKNLSEQKKAWQKRKDDANRYAAQTILQPQKWQMSGEIDLHGLYLDEALDATRAFLKHWSKKVSSRDTVLIITGAGNHSENNKAVIKPKVEQMLRQQRLEYELVHGGGAFKVTLKPRQ